ncbi:MAG TPA: DeoR/GlpR family DNA-binding transcription regulator [Bryobacteraceae bacterium]|jgi:DeoR family glycerol-3-phosphate regulon repressor
MRPSNRRDAIIDLVRERERVTVDFLARQLRASCETIRRDLTDLAARGLIRKFHGGATLPDVSGAGLKTEGSFQSRMQDHLREKRTIGRRAASLFSPGDTLLIDTGTTTVIFAEELTRLSRLTVITNSLAIAQIMARGEGNRAFLLGGEYSDDASENLGTLAVEQVSRFHATHAVLTVGAIEADGIFDYNLNEAEIARAMIAQSRHVTVLADSSKFGRSALFQVCTLAAIDRLVVNEAPDGAMVEALRAAEVEVIIAPASEAVVKIA